MIFPLGDVFFIAPHELCDGQVRHITPVAISQSGQVPAGFGIASQHSAGLPALAQALVH
jgi:hypothetical protein